MRIKIALCLTAVVSVTAAFSQMAWADYSSKTHQHMGGVKADDVALAVPPGVTFQTKWFGDGAGHTLYISDKDVAGKSSCAADCAQDWKPLIAPETAKASGNWTLSDRGDGTRQWAFKGKPLYTFAADKDVGDSKGNGADGGTWRALAIEEGQKVATPAGISVRDVAIAAGWALVDDRGHTLYTVDAGDRDKLGIAAEWKPVKAPAIAHAIGDFSIVKGSDETYQWAYKGRALFSSVRDAAPGDAKGIGADPRWHAALVARYFTPPGVSVRFNPGPGAVLTTPAGLALYMRDSFRYQIGTHYSHNASRGTPADGRRIGLKGCEAECLTIWHPFLAGNDAQPSGHWTLLMRDDGTRQWAYRGYALYSYTGDNNPGDMKGNDVYDVLFSQTATKIADESLSVSLNWHVVYP